MKSTKLLPVIMLAAALTAFTSGGFAANITNVQSTKSRAEVRQALSQAYPHGTSGQQEYVDFGPSPVQSVTTRASVKAQLAQSSASMVLQPRDVYYGG